jgi:hypothetical protein
MSTNTTDEYTASGTGGNVSDTGGGDGDVPKNVHEKEAMARSSRKESSLAIDG